MLAFTNVSKQFGAVQALDGCSFSVERGRMLGFLGPNGERFLYAATHGRGAWRLDLPKPKK